MNKILMWILIVVGVLILLAIGGLLVTLGPGGQIEKPAIYLYPVEDSQIDVKVLVNGELTLTIPDYENGWNVFVTKEGIIENKYDYLFYEADLNIISLPEEGWVIKYEELNNWFENQLPILGLNEKETSQFIEYWMERLPKANYYEIKLFEDKFLKENMDLLITPTPDTLIRLEFNFKALEDKITLPEPTIKTPERNGFVVVEWGGILEK